MLILGALLAGLAPLAGFLGGSIVGGDAAPGGLTPMYLWLFVGLVIGGVGGVIAILGGLKVVREHTRQLR